jgi:hypothetical protein
VFTNYAAKLRVRVAYSAYDKSYDQRDLKVANLRNLNFEVIFVVIRLKNILMRLKLSEGGTLVSMPVYFAPKVTGNYVSLTRQVFS